ncbi:MAG TPA: M13 family metallopeptidase [Flavisolibacter sp.]|jgi:putative endopeptidase|nr:M13 family metallopeptidase [Flavisolibacter sp.]
MNAFFKVLTIGAVASAVAAFSDKKPKFIDPSNMDMSVKPGDNFYAFANGGWLKKNPVPASKTRWGSFDMLREESSRRMQTLLEDAGKNTTKDRSTQMIGDFYRSGMDSTAIETLGYTPIKSDLDRLAALATKQDVINEIATLRTKGMGAPLFGVFVAQDRKNVSQYIPQIGQGGTTLPDRDYYIKDDARSTAIRTAYRNHIEKMFSLVGENATSSAYGADAILRIETALAKAQYSRVEMRDPYKTYNKFSVKDLNTQTPGLNWSNLLSQMKVQSVDSVLVGNPSFLKMADVLLSALPLQDWKTYLRWNVLKGAAPYLSSAFVNESFKLSQVLTGQKEQTPRWQRISGLIDGTLGDLLGQLYVQKYFKGEAKTRMQEMVANLQTTFADRINRLDWMSAATKQKALQKLNAFAKKIAYPDKWKDYQGVTVSGTDFISNLRSTGQWSYNYMVNRLGKPVDKTEWGMTPPTINAYYNPVNNEIAFPAGILQFPFFDFGADDAIIYGGIGSVIGHEMSHGFDDSGAQYAASGNLENWWTKEDEAKFKEKANQVVNQYNAYTVLDTVHVNGRLTLGENIADIGGLSIAYEAFSKTKQFKDAKKIDGFTPQQRFFLSWAQIWRNNAVPETQAQLILTDSHSPGQYRANGAVVNIDEWYTAFNVQPGEKLYVAPEKRIKIW